MLKIKLLKPHTHAGVDYPAGTEIEVPKDYADWLKEHGIIIADQLQKTERAE